MILPVSIITRKKTSTLSPPYKMTYQFDNPPRLEALIEEFGVSQTRLIAIESCIRTAASEVSEGEFDYFKDRYSMEESAFILKKIGILEAFAFLCSLPNRGTARLLMLISEPWAVLPGLFDVTARFDSRGQVTTWQQSLMDFNGQIGSTDPNCHAGKIEPAWAYYKVESSQAPLTVLRLPLSIAQWYRKFLAERWYEPCVSPSDRLVDPIDRKVWDRFSDGKLF